MYHVDDDRRRILVIDDNPAIHDDYRKILTANASSEKLLIAEAAFFDEVPPSDANWNFQLDSAFQGREGLEMIASAVAENRPYQLAFVDMRMPPGWDGIKTIEEIWKADPNLQVVICTAYSDNTWQDICEHLGGTDQILILKKPFDAIEVSQLAVAMTEKWHLTRQASLKHAELERLVDERTARLRDIEASLKQQKDFLELAASVAQVGYWRMDLTSRELTWSANVFNIFGMDANTFSPDFNTFLAMHHTKDRAVVSAKIQQSIHHAASVEFKARVIQPCGRLRHIHTKTISEIGPDNQPLALFGVTRDITENEIAMAAVQYAAFHDPLTGLANRAKFHDRLAHSLELSAVHDRNASLILVDLDEFKEVNDTLGHPAGDTLLKSIAGRLNNCTRAADTVARLGGDEFAIVQSPVDHPQPVAGLVRQIYEEMKRPFLIDGKEVNVGFSAGVVIAPTDGADPDELLRNVDLALYNAKREMPGTFCFFEPKMDARMKQRRRIEQGLKSAIENDEFILHYQPIFETSTNEIQCIEALLRWQHPEQGLLAPGEFIEIAEDSGLITPIGNWVLEHACQDATKLPAHVCIAVNVSPIQFRDHTLVSSVSNALRKSGLEPNRLELEITESVMLGDGEETKQQLHRLRDKGVRVVMDDFGTGYSSLSYLRSFPFDRIKLDRSFVVDATTEDDAKEIVRVVAGLGRSLGMETIAEGVETEAQLARISEEGFTHFQGFLRGQPSALSVIQQEFLTAVH